MKKITINQLQEFKNNHDKFSCLTAYDASMAHMVNKAEIEVVLVGDSLGMVVQGQDSTIPVSVSDMAYHCKIVSQASPHSLVMVDMPFMSYASLDTALENASTLMQAGADILKIEGGAWLEETVHKLTERGVPVCAHLGLTPQWVKSFGGYKIQGKTDDEADKIVADAQQLVNAGASIVLLECVPQEVARRVTQSVKVPVIGIGCGPVTDAQVLVSYDILGLTMGKTPRFAKNYLQESKGDIETAFRLFRDEVHDGVFPGEEHTLC